LLLTGCASNTVRLSQKIPNGASISTVALFHDKALFKETGFTKYGNKSYYHSVPNLDLNNTIMTSLEKDLNSLRQFKVVSLPINKTQLTKISTREMVSQGDTINPFYKKLLSKVTRFRT